MTSTFDLRTMGRSSIDLYANDVGAAFVDIKSFAGCPNLMDGLKAQMIAEAAIESLLTNQPVKITYWSPE